MTQLISSLKVDNPYNFNCTRSYRYGFQGQENDNEIKGDNNSVNYKYRMHDPRVGRFFAVDPLRYMYPFFSPYQFSGNCVINSVELEGLEGDTKFEIQETQKYALQTKQSYRDVKAQLYGFPTDGSMEQVHMVLDAFGMVPVIGEVADGINALFYVMEGDYENASISALAIVPIIGESGKVTKYIYKSGDEAVGLIKNGEKLDDVTDATKVLKKSDLPPACFVSGTIVKTSEGNVNIEDIQIDDLVWSFNETSLLVELKEVEELFITVEAKTLIKIKVEEETIFTTPEHPFYIDGKWIQAKYLMIGNPITTFNSKNCEASSIIKNEVTYYITSLEVVDTNVTVYNFKVDDNHDYYVTDLGVLVHNNPCANKPKIKPEAKYTGSKKHGTDWTEGPATAKNTGIPQGQWSKKDLDFATEKAGTLKPGEGKYFKLPEGSSSKIHKPDGTTVKADHIWVRNNGTGTFHGYPTNKPNSL